MTNKSEMTVLKDFVQDGFHCVIVEINWSGHLCGYVEIPEGHLLHDLSYCDDKFPNLDVHGGITFTGELSGFGGFYIGFDCAHHGDIPRKIAGLLSDQYGTYKDEAFVTKQLKRLVGQIKRLKKVVYEDYKIVVSE